MPIYDSGRLVHHMTMRGAVVITKGDNKDEPNIMFGDIITSFFLRECITEGPVQFPMWRSLDIPMPQIRDFRLPLPIDPN